MIAPANPRRARLEKERSEILLPTHDAFSVQVEEEPQEGGQAKSALCDDRRERTGLCAVPMAHRERTVHAAGRAALLPLSGASQSLLRSRAPHRALPRRGGACPSGPCLASTSKYPKESMSRSSGSIVYSPDVVIGASLFRRLCPSALVCCLSSALCAMPCTAMGGVRTVNENEQVVVQSFGKLNAVLDAPGLWVVNPCGAKTTRISTRACSLEVGPGPKRLMAAAVRRLVPPAPNTPHQTAPAR